ncbi:hypothetical protein IMCC1989_2842 [gamma proteobacterium IMCC1989]|nr:hypothetical protein IMCC1989_2842 [gamma proteobacterium IMCC1989]
MKKSETKEIAKHYCLEVVKKHRWLMLGRNVVQMPHSPCRIVSAEV